MPSLKLGDTALIVAECKAQALPRAQAANVLAQVNWETGGTMKPVRETFAKSDGAVKSALTKAFKAGKLTWVKADYWTAGWFGRGHIQLTHEANYRKAGKALGVDLIGNPSLALDPAISAAIAVRGMKDGWFTGKKLADFINKSKTDHVGARAIVNGDKNKEPKGSKLTIGQIIEERAKDYDLALRIGGYDASAKQEPAPAETPVKDMAMSLGDSGPLVEELQRNLTSLGVSVPETGKFDKATEDAVKAFQSLHKDEDGNPLKVDGKVGHRTSKAIERALLKPKIEEAKKTVPPTADKAVKEKSNFWLWIMGLFGGGSGGLSAAFSSDWQTVLAVGGVVIVALIVLLLMRHRILAAFDDINARAKT